jgi:hypothetical protein
MDEQVIEQIDGVRLSLSALAREFGIARETVAKRLAAAGVQPDGERKGWPVYRVAPAARALVPAEAPVWGGGRVEDPDRLVPTDRKAWYQSEKDRLVVEREQGLLVPVEAVREQVAGVVKTTTLMLETLPDLLERDCRLPPEAVERMERQIDRVRADWAERLEA